MMFSLAFAAALQQPKELISISVFRGGAGLEYIRFLNTMKVFPGPTTVIQENIDTAYGRSRCLIYSDGSRVMQPPVDSDLMYVRQGKGGSVHSKRLPALFFQLEPNAKPDLDDHVITNVPAIGNSGPRFLASLLIKNGMPSLNIPVKVHPFFDDFRIHILWGNTMSPEVLTYIATCIGGKVIKSSSTPTFYSIEADVEEVRRRAIATYDYYSPSAGPKYYGTRETLSKKLFRSMTTEQFSKWIDAAKSTYRIPASQLPIAKELDQYRTEYIDYMQSRGHKLFTGDSGKHMRIQPMYVEFDRHLGFRIYIGLENGSEFFF